MRTAVMVALIVVSVSASAQEIDPDTLQDIDSQQNFDAMMIDALPGSSATVRLDRNHGLEASRLLLEHPNYRLGYVRTVSIPERWWTMFGDSTWSAALGHITMHRSLGTLTATSRGMGRSVLIPQGTGHSHRRKPPLLHSPFHSGIGGLNGLGFSFRWDSVTTIHGAAGVMSQGLIQPMAIVAADSRFGVIETSVSFLALGTVGSVELSGSTSLAFPIGRFGFSAELAFDAAGRAALQCVAAVTGRGASGSLTLWDAHPLCNQPMGALLATGRPVSNSWGGNLRVRATMRGVATARFSVTLSGTHGRSWLLPMAGRMLDVIADVDQRVTTRLLVEWRLRYRQDDDGVSAVLRSQIDRHLWMIRVRLVRQVHTRLDVRCNVDLRLMQKAAWPLLRGSLGWVEVRWESTAGTVLRARASVFASDDFDVSPSMVEVAARGLQTLFTASGYGRRASLGIEWRLSPSAFIALQTGIESRLVSGVHRSTTDLRLAMGLSISRTEAIRSVASPADDMPLPHE